MTKRLDYSEKRDFVRMHVKCTVDYRVAEEGESRLAEGHNLSAGGVQFETDQMLPEGTQLEITISPEQKLTPPLEATAEVVRAEPSPDGRHLISCRFQKVKS